MEAQTQIRKALAEEVPEVKIATQNVSSVIAIVNRTDVAEPINCIALADVISKEYKWTLNKIQRPTGCHLAITLASAPDWRQFVDAVKGSVKLMKEKPELNHNSNVATYGMAAKIPDLSFMGNICKLHSAALLDSL